MYTVVTLDSILVALPQHIAKKHVFWIKRCYSIVMLRLRHAILSLEHKRVEFHGLQGHREPLFQLESVVEETERHLLHRRAEQLREELLDAHLKWQLQNFQVFQTHSSVQNDNSRRYQPPPLT